jgi:8-hydroxy-5-deazaflavin:NADPH oxidoreductase
MKVTVVGYGHMGSAFTRRLTASGHEVVLTGRDLEEAKKVAAEIGGRVRVEPPARAAADSDLVIGATPFSEQANALRSLGDLGGKAVVDISNPLKPDMSGLAVGHTTSAGEEIARALPGGKVVKAFNTLFAQLLAEGAKLEGGKAVPVFYAGDDEGAKQTVRSLIEGMGFEPIDAGPLQNARYLEPMAFLNIWFGYVAKQGTQIAPAWLKRA